MIDSKTELVQNSFKRRPKSYKTNKVTSFTETIRNLIDFQMNYIKQVNEAQEHKNNKEKDNIQKRERSYDQKESKHKKYKYHDI